MSLQEMIHTLEREVQKSYNNFYTVFSEERKILHDLFQKDKRNVLYGAAANGDLLYKVLSSLGISIDSYVVSDGVSHDYFLNGIPIINLSQMSEIENYNVIITAGIQWWGEILPALSARPNVHTVASLEFQAYCEMLFLHNYFEQNNVRSNGDTLLFENGLVVQNPFLLSRRDITAVAIEFFDLILPFSFHDHTMLVEGPYEHSAVVLRKGDVVLDCGANIGLFSCMAASVGAVSYAFEPTKEQHVLLNRFSNVYQGRIMSYEYALSDSVGSARFMVSDSWHTSNSLVLPSENMREVEVPTITVDQFVEERGLDRVDFIKADIEGAERMMLKGAERTLADFAPRLAICTYHLPDDPKVIAEIILGANPYYEITQKWKKLYASVGV